MKLQLKFNSMSISCQSSYLGWFTGDGEVPVGTRFITLRAHYDITSYVGITYFLAKTKTSQSLTNIEFFSPFLHIISGNWEIIYQWSALKNPPSPPQQHIPISILSPHLKNGWHGRRIISIHCTWWQLSEPLTLKIKQLFKDLTLFNRKPTLPCSQVLS